MILQRWEHVFFQHCVQLLHALPQEAHDLEELLRRPTVTFRVDLEHLYCRLCYATQIFFSHETTADLEQLHD